MKDFVYVAAPSVGDAVKVLAEHGDRAKILAGGTDILVQLREGQREADVVLDVKKISNGKLEDFPLERGDTVVVRDWFF